MGKKSFRSKNRGGGRSGGRDNGDRGVSWKDFSAMPKENEKLERYYNQLLQLPEEEKQQYWDALKRELPNSFRFCGHKGHAIAVKRLLQTRYIPVIKEIEHLDGRPAEPPMPVPWYPDELAWWMTTPKNVIRKFLPFAAFQKFLVSETSIGNISRQEVVSMIPPLLIDLQPGMTVLDMCAAPGSKAAQLLEMVHSGEEARVRKVVRSFAKEDGLDLGKETKEEAEADLNADPSDAGRATGLLIANDSDYKRGHMLVHQLKRLSSPNLIVTNHDATMFPSIKLPSATNRNAYLKFDRILADVPCSGDGTTRKNANLWKDWQPGSALGLHTTQVRILVRALQLLKVGGRVVFSTCSMNPVENESVVATAIERCGGLSGVDIIDCSDKLSELKRYPGLKSWNVMDKSARIWNTWEEVEQFARESNDGVIPGRLANTMFPRLEGSDCADLPLDRCMRVYPHMQDTGAFFITVLEKKSDFKVKNENEAKQPVVTSNESNGATVAPTASDTEMKEPVADESQEATVVEPAPVVETDGVGETPGEDGATNGSKRTLEADDVDENPTKKVKTEVESTTVATPPRQKMSVENKQKKATEEPYKYLDPSHPVIQNVKGFYHLSSRFPDNRYMVRNEMGEPAKAIYYTTALTRDILTENEGRGLKFIHAGVRMFMKQDAPSAEVCRWRIQSEGMPILQGYVGEPRVIHLRNKETFRKLLIEMFPRIADGQWKNFDEIGEQVRDIGMGCCVLRIEPDGDDPDFTEHMALPLWKSVHSLNLMLPKEDRSAMLLRVFNDTSPLINTTLQKQKESQEKREAEEAETGDAEEQKPEIPEDQTDTKDAVIAEADN